MATTKRKRPPKAVIAVVVLLLVGGGIWWWWDSQASAETTTTETLSGSIEATQYQISPAIAGRVTKVLVAEGDTVTKDQEVVRLDRTALKLTVTQAKQGVTAAKAALTNVKNDDDSTKADVTAAKAKLKQAEAQVELAQVQLAYTIVTAPQAGTVTSVTTNVGQNAAPAKTLLTVLDPASLFARVYVSETEIGNVKVGQDVTLVTDSSTSQFKGTVSYIASEAQFTPNTIQTKEQRVKLVYEVRVRIADDSGTLKPGMPVDVTLS
ncbi:MAG: efflux RND transporter periplasmic adaptor subunit [Propionicimonas sp.]|uniref:HlyD family secretion protein n=1 Tax=Propionicimonas sp. TaxID=1955623 RepID=UPI002B1F0258|nr:efflux RND transporter periplasmic adaptor subunit [Propionicimonas sp.]MEA4945245.1 efflux RND transporter periplasmic adaptor subunit [Propionicimonas sp.]MEA5055670.1 efflux RND transporter periplasmic adaptor subunit [Propionicimonas sp.]MEA5118874.1 efflux RND transporter periplasmic adaptor subunit [Propionicimonas sp.]